MIPESNPATSPAESADPAGSRHVVITGLMGIGKSTTATALAARLGRPHRDSDRDIETLFGVTGSDLAREHGVDELHRMESAVLLGALADERPLVVSAAAWVVEDPRCVAALAARAVTVVLEAPIDEILARIATGRHRRAMDRQELEALAARRAPMFTAVADLVLDATMATEQLVVAIRKTMVDR